MGLILFAGHLPDTLIFKQKQRFLANFGDFLFAGHLLKTKDSMQLIFNAKHFISCDTVTETKKENIKTMPKVLNYGSISIDIIYSVPHIVKNGETITVDKVEISAGGKGANQSTAFAKAGLEIYNAGKLGKNGLHLIGILKSFNVDTSLMVVTDDDETGKAIIQVDREGNNAIFIAPADNRKITEEEIDNAFKQFEAGDYLILQNEINNLDYLIRRAHEKGMKICINPAPFDERINKLPLELVDIIIANEIEGLGLSGCKEDSTFDEILEALVKKFPQAEIVMTVGDKGSYYGYKNERIHQDIFPVEVVDTTAAGDTFIGYFLASKLQGLSIAKCLEYASKASSITVTRVGAMKAIPTKDEVF